MHERSLHSEQSRELVGGWSEDEAYQGRRGREAFSTEPAKIVRLLVRWKIRFHGTKSGPGVFLAELNNCWVSGGIRDRALLRALLVIKCRHLVEVDQARRGVIERFQEGVQASIRRGLEGRGCDEGAKSSNASEGGKDNALYYPFIAHFKGMPSHVGGSMPPAVDIRIPKICTELSG